MLKSIDPILSSDLLAVLNDMGHGDEVAVTDANFPAASHAARLVCMPGLDAERVLAAILSVFPLDDFVDAPVIAMASADDRLPVHDALEKVVRASDVSVELQLVDRHDFYDRARQAYAIVATGERRFYANLILKKGTVA